MDFPTNFCVCAAHYFLCAAAEGTLLLTPGSYEELVAASIVPVAVTIVIVYYRLWQSWWFFWTEKNWTAAWSPPVKKSYLRPCAATPPSPASLFGHCAYVQKRQQLVYVCKNNYEYENRRKQLIPEPTTGRLWAGLDQTALI